MLTPGLAILRRFPALTVTMVVASAGAFGATLPQNEYRLVLFAPAGPVLVRVELESGDQPIAEIRAAVAKEMWERLDVDKSGALEPAEWSRIPLVGDATIDPGQFAKEGRLDLDGVRVLLDARLGPVFRVMVKPKRLDQTVRLVDLLDRDADGTVSLEEATHSLSALRALDLDDDEMLSVAELQPFPASIRQAQALQIAEDPQVALIVVLDSESAVSAAVRRIQSDNFAQGETSLPLDRCGFRKGATRFDADGDGALNPDELTAWLNDSEPDATLAVRLPDRGLARVHGETVRSRRLTESNDSPRTWKATLDGTELEADAINNRVMQRDFVRLTGIRFIQADADDSGYLSESEFSGLQLRAPFSAVDANGDGMAQREEVDAYTRQMGQLTQTQIVLTVSDDIKSLFQLMDEDENRRLSTRELRTVGERLARHDQNGNGRLDSSDFLSRYRLSFAFAIPAGMVDERPAMSMTAMGGRPPRLQKVGPVWFQKMDRNRDLDISWREFLGPRSAFDALDANRDGLIDRHEAEATPGPSEAGPAG